MRLPVVHYQKIIQSMFDVGLRSYLSLYLVLLPSLLPLYALENQGPKEGMSMGDVVSQNKTQLQSIYKIMKEAGEDPFDPEMWQIILAVMSFISFSKASVDGLGAFFQTSAHLKELKELKKKIKAEQKHYDAKYVNGMLKELDRRIHDWEFHLEEESRQKVAEELARSQGKKSRKNPQAISQTLKEKAQSIVSSYNAIINRKNAHLPETEKLPSLRYNVQESEFSFVDDPLEEDKVIGNGRLRGKDFQYDIEELKQTLATKGNEACRIHLTKLAEARKDLISRRRSSFLIPAGYLSVSIASAYGVKTLDEVIKSNGKGSFAQRQAEEQKQTAIMIDKAKALYPQLMELAKSSEKNALNEFVEILREVMVHNESKIKEYFETHLTHEHLEMLSLDSLIHRRLEAPQEGKEGGDYVREAFVTSLASGAEGKQFSPEDIIALITHKDEAVLETRTTGYLMVVFEKGLAELFPKLNFADTNSHAKLDLIGPLVDDTLRKIRGNQLIQEKKTEILKKRLEEGDNQMSRVEEAISAPVLGNTNQSITEGTLDSPLTEPLAINLHPSSTSNPKTGPDSTTLVTQTQSTLPVLVHHHGDN